MDPLTIRARIEAWLGSAQTDESHLPVLVLRLPAPFTVHHYAYCYYYPRTGDWEPTVLACIWSDIGDEPIYAEEWLPADPAQIWAWIEDVADRYYGQEGASS